MQNWVRRSICANQRQTYSYRLWLSPPVEPSTASLGNQGSKKSNLSVLIHYGIVVKCNRFTGAIPRCDDDGITRCCALVRYIRRLFAITLTPHPCPLSSLPHLRPHFSSFCLRLSLSSVSHPCIQASRSSPSPAVAAYETPITQFHEDPWRVQTVIVSISRVR